MLRRPSVLFVLGAFVLAFLHASLWSAISPFWQNPDEAAHFEVVALTGELGRPVGPADNSPVLQARMLRSMWEDHYWEFLGLKRPESPPTRMIAAFGSSPVETWPDTWVIDDTYIGYFTSLNNTSQPLYYLALAPVARLTAGQSIDDQLRALRFGSRILFALAVAVITRTAWVLFDGNRPLTAATAVIAGLLPMFAYIGAGLSNDSGVALAGAVVCLSVASGWRRGFSLKRTAVIVVACIAAVLTKRTAIFYLAWVPLVLALRYFSGLPPARRVRLVALGVGAAAVLAVVAVALYVTPGRSPAGWSGPLAAPAWTSQDAHSGARSFKVGVSGAPALTSTFRIAPSRSENREVTLEAWARGGAGSLSLIGDSGRSADVTVGASPGWRPISVTLPAGSTIARLFVVISGVEAAPLLIDDVRATFGDGVAIGPPNASAEDIVPALGDFVIDFARWLGVANQAQRMVRDYRANLAALPRIAGGAAQFMVMTFWGRFGSFALRDNPGVAPETSQPLIALAVLGVISILAQAIGKHVGPAPRVAMLVWLAGAGLLIAQTFAPMLSFAVGGNWGPQGRYLFSGMALLCPLMAQALLGLLPARWRPAAVIVIAAMLVAFAGWCGLQSLAYYTS